MHMNNTTTTYDHKALTVRHSNRCAICGHFTIKVNGQDAAAGDAVLLEHEPVLRLEGGRDAEVLVFDLARQVT